MFNDYPKEYDERLWEIAKAECERLKKERPEILEYLKMYYGYSNHHRGFGMYLRNKYARALPKMQWDSVGNEIMYRMTALMFPVFKNDLYAVDMITNATQLFNVQYYLKYDDYLVNIIDPWGYFKSEKWDSVNEDLDSFDKAREECRKYLSAAYEKILDYDNFRITALRLGYSEDEILDTRAISYKAFEKERCCLPLEILFFNRLTADSIKCAMKQKSIFEWIAQWIFRLIEYIPDYAKECREFVQLMTEANSNALKYFPKFCERSDTI